MSVAYQKILWKKRRVGYSGLSGSISAPVMKYGSRLLRNLIVCSSLFYFRHLLLTFSPFCSKLSIRGYFHLSFSTILFICCILHIL